MIAGLRLAVLTNESWNSNSKKTVLPEHLFSPAPLLEWDPLPSNFMNGQRRKHGSWATLTTHSRSGPSNCLQHESQSCVSPPSLFYPTAAALESGPVCLSFRVWPSLPQLQCLAQSASASVSDPVRLSFGVRPSPPQLQSRAQSALALE